MTKPIVWNENLFMVCRECGARKSYESPFDLNIYVGDLSVFSKTHRNCKGKDSEISLPQSLKQLEVASL